MTRYLNYKQAAAYLSMPESTLRAMVSQRRVPHSRVSKRIVRFDPAELDGWIAAHKVTP